jgi:tetratricopeptide (TPR) repeat protein
MVPPSQLSDCSTSQEDFGNLVRRIVQTNSGNFPVYKAIDSQENDRITGTDRAWFRYKRLALAAQEVGNFSQAEAMWIAALGQDIDKKDSRLAYTLESLASLYATLGRFEQAELFSLRAVDATIELSGENSAKTAAAMNSLAGIYFSQRRYESAESLCKRVLQIYEDAFGPDATNVGMAANNLAMVYHAQKKFEEAKKMYDRAFQIGHRALGPNHSCIVSLRKNFENLLRQMSEVSQKLQSV